MAIRFHHPTPTTSAFAPRAHLAQLAAHPPHTIPIFCLCWENLEQMIPKEQICEPGISNFLFPNKDKYLLSISQQTWFPDPRLWTKFPVCSGFSQQITNVCYLHSLFGFSWTLKSPQKTDSAKRQIFVFALLLVVFANKDKCLFDIRFHFPTKQTFVRGAKTLFGFFWTNKTSLFRVCSEIV